MLLRPPLTRFADEPTLQASLAALDGGPWTDPASATACAWYLRQYRAPWAAGVAHATHAAYAREKDPQPQAIECRGYLDLVLAEVALWDGELQAAEGFVASARERFAAVPGSAGPSDADWIAANLANDRGDMEAREALMTSSLYRADAMGDVERAQAGTLALAVFDALTRGSEAERTWSRRVEDLLRARAPALRSFAHFYTFVVRTNEGRFAEALEHAVLSQRAAEASGMLRRAILDGCNVAPLLLDLGDLEGALHHMEKVLEQARGCGWPMPLGCALAVLSYVMRNLGRHQAAAQLAEEGLALLAPFAGTNHHMTALEVLADASLALGELDRAQHCYGAVAAPPGRIDFPENRLYGLLGLAQVAKARGQLDEARGLCRQALDEAPRSDPRVHVRALRLYAELLDGGPGPECGGPEPPRLLRKALLITATKLDGANRHELLNTLSEQLERRGRHTQALAARKEAQAAMAVEKERSAARLAVALEVRWRAERLHAEAEQHRGDTVDARRVAELESQNQQLHAAKVTLERRNVDLGAACAHAEDLSLTDPLTGLRNRRFFERAIEPAVAESLRACEAGTQHDILFFMLDLDHFKRINDEQGHGAGDAVLAQLRERLRTVTRIDDFLVRWGGEEFLVAVRGVGRAEGPAIAERLRLAVCTRRFDIGEGRTLEATVSIGFAPFPLDTRGPRGATWQQAVELADERLRAAKREGRNRYIGEAA